MESTREWYLRAADELAETSAVQRSRCLRIAAEPAVLALLDSMPREVRQPSRLFAVACLLGAPDDEDAWIAWVLANADALRAELPRRGVQANEVGRCAPLLAALARIPGPLALLELGAAAGLCLFPDRYRYRIAEGERVREFGDPDALPVIDVRADAGLFPDAPVDIRWRRGIDLAPLDVRNEGDVRWLHACLPAESVDRHERLAHAIGVVASDPPVLLRGDALATLAEALAQVPQGTTPVVASLGTAVYLAPDARAELLGRIAAAGARAVTFEPLRAIPTVADAVARAVDEGRAASDARFVLALDGEPLASGTAHGGELIAVRPAGRRSVTASRP